jgi:tight adherence protein B
MNVRMLLSVWGRRLSGPLAAAVAVIGVAAPAALAAEAPAPASLSDIRVTSDAVKTTLVVRGDDAAVADPKSIKVTLGGRPASVSVQPAAKQSRTTMLVIDTSGSMGAAGMGTVRSAVRGFLGDVPKDVKVGLVSFATTAGVDVAPTTNHAAVSREVASLRSKGETALYEAIQVAVAALGTQGERSIILLSDGGDTVAEIEGGKAGEASQRKAALTALKRAKVRAEVVAFKSPESNGAVLKQFADAGGGSVANAEDRKAVNSAFSAAARALESQALLIVKRPVAVRGAQEMVVRGTADGRPFEARSVLDLGDLAPAVAPTTATTGPTTQALPAVREPITAWSPEFLIPSVLIMVVGMFLLVTAFAGPVFRSRRKERLAAIETYGVAASPAARRQTSSPAALSEQLVQMGDKVMDGRESTPKTIGLINRADLPWRAGEWFVLRIVAVLVGAALGVVVFRSHPALGVVVGLLLGFFLPPFLLRHLARRRAKKFEDVLPDVLMLVATSLGSGFSLLQALDAVAKDSPEPASKEFSRVLAEARIGTDVSDALDHMAVRMDSENMRWTTMAIRIQREVGGNLGETLRTTATTLRERGMLRRQVRALSAEGRLSAYVLVGLPVLLFVYSYFANYDYVSLLWTTLLGIVMSIAGLIAMAIGILWMRRIVDIEV